MGVVIRQSIKASVSNYFGILLGFASLFMLFPLYFEPEELGAIRLLLESGAVMSTFALLGTNYSINRFFPYFKTEDKRHHGFFFWVFITPAFGYLIILIGLLLFREPLLALFNKDAGRLDGLYSLLLVLVFFTLLQQVTESAAANHGRIAVPNFFREVAVRIVQIIAGYLFYIGLISLYTAIVCIVLSYAVAFAGNLLFLRMLTPVHLRPDLNFLRSNPQLRNDMLRFTGFLFIGGFTGLVVNKIDFLMISSMRSLADTAIYSIGFYLAMLMDIPKRTLLQISAPIVAQHVKDENTAELQSIYKKITLNQVVAGTLLFYFIWINIDNLYQIMPRGDYYSTGKWVFFTLGLARIMEAMGAGAGAVIVNSKFYPLTLLSFGVSAVVAITANYFLIPSLGIQGAALATLVTVVLSQALVVSIVHRKTGMHPFSPTKILLFLILGAMLIPAGFGKWLHNPFLDGMLRTAVLGGGFLYLVYAFRISDDMNELANGLLKRISRNRISRLPTLR
jgi:O-antigen/teichoic acid export membrane protein